MIKIKYFYYHLWEGPEVCGIWKDDARGGEDFGGSGDVGHAHLVGGEGAGLVGADEVDAAERLHRRQPLHHRVPG